MNREAIEAVEAAISFEAKKDGLTQKQSGDWMLRLTIAASDMDVRITGAAMGTLYQVVIVEVDDDGTAHDHKAEERQRWRDLGATKQSGIRCTEPTFWAFLREKKHHPEVRGEEAAAIAVRDLCEVSSRSDFNKPGFGDKRALWHQLDNDYQAWKVRENHG